MFVELKIDESVAYLTLNRPDKRNAYHSEMLYELEAGINAILALKDVQVVIIGTSSNHFCSGADLKEMAHRSYQDVINLQSRRIFEILNQMPLITIAAVKGYAIAGGFELALACDFILAEEKAKFWLPEVEIGLIPAAGGIDRLVQRLGPGLAKEIIICGRKLNALEAWEMHLVTQTAPDIQFDAEVTKFAKSILTKPIEALQIAKIAINEATSLHKSSLHLFGQAFLNQLRVNKPYKPFAGY